MFISQKVQKPDQLVPYFIHQIVGHLPGLTGLFVSCVFSAGLSTMSANLNSLAGVIYEDCIKPQLKSHQTDQKGGLIMKSIVVIFGGYCVLMGLFMQKFGSILQLVLLVLSVTNGTTLGVYLLGMLWPHANEMGAIYGSVISTIFVGVLVVYNQLNVLKGYVVIPELPTSIEKCSAEDILAFNR